MYTKLNRLTLSLICTLLFATTLPANARAQSVWPQPSMQILGKVPSSYKEVSGMVASRSQPGVFWINTDSGNSASAYAFRLRGTTPVLIAKYPLSGPKIGNVDWEDISVGKGPDGKDWIYIGDIGNNALNRNNVRSRSMRIHRFPEPLVPEDLGQTAVPSLRITPDQIETLFITYPERVNFNSEAMAVHPVSGDVYIATKVHTGARNKKEPRSMLFSVPRQLTQGKWIKQSDPGISQFTQFEPLFVGELNQPPARVTSMEFSASGNLLAILNYNSFQVFFTYGMESNTEFSKQPLVTVPFDEPPAEGILFASDGSVWISSESSRRVKRFAW